MTSTFVIMDVSEECFKEISAKLSEAGYNHVFSLDNELRQMIDMDGMRLRVGLAVHVEVED